MIDTESKCICGHVYTLLRFYPFDQSQCPDCRAEERRKERLRGSHVPAYLRRDDDLIMLRKQSD